MNDEFKSGFVLRSVGWVRSPVKDASLVVNAGDLEWRGNVQNAGQRRKVNSEQLIDAGPDGILDGIKEFSHLIVLYWAHLVPPEGRSILKEHTKGRKDFPLVGIFPACRIYKPVESE